MARVTVEDCILHVPNRFELVILASERAKKIANGAPLTVDRDNDKDAVVSLREIGDKTISIEQLREETIIHYSRYQRADVIETTVEEEGESAFEMEIEEAGRLVAAHQEEELENEYSFDEENIDVED